MSDPRHPSHQADVLAPLNALVGCPECDHLMRKVPIACGERALCPCCGHELYSHRPRMLRRGLALVTAALLLYVPANFLPLMQLNLLGQQAADTLWTAVLALFESGMPVMAVLVLMCSMLIPLVKLLCLLYVLLSIRWGRGRHWGLLLYRAYHHLREWGMLEVYLMGVLVSMVKLAGLADLTPGPGLACFIGLLLLQVWLEVTLSPHQIWAALSGEDDRACH